MDTITMEALDELTDTDLEKTLAAKKKDFQIALEKYRTLCHEVELLKNEAAKRKAEFAINDRVTLPRYLDGRIFQITKIIDSFGHPSYYGVRVRKDGSLAKVEQSLSGTMIKIDG